MTSTICRCQWGLSLTAAILAAAGAAAQAPSGDALNEATEAALKAAAGRAAPCVVQIETTGGAEIIGAGRGGRGFRKGVGPTTGLILGPDGFVVSSAFNFAQKPASILVSVPGRRDRFIARIVATDQTRMVTLLKIDAADLPTPEVLPKSAIQIGQWTAALGRALDANVNRAPSMSVGVVSALNRITGKAIQTDAKISPTNYGGPLVDLDGRVMGLLVPAAPRGETETAGVEWYDSGIGFAIPLEDIQAVLPKLKQGRDLRRGILGVTAKSTDHFGAPVEIGAVAPDSAAAKAGLLPGDVVVSLDNVPIANQNQMQQVLGPKYEGDEIQLTIRRGKDERKFEKITLGGAVTSFLTPSIGILAVRDDPEPGVEIRWVEPNSAADKAGVRPGDRLLKVAPASAAELRRFSGRDELRALLAGIPVGTELKCEIQRKGDGKNEPLTLKLGSLSNAVPESLPTNATARKALEPRKATAPQGPAPTPPKGDKPAPAPEEKKSETGYLERTTPAKDHSFWLYVPANYDRNVSHALVVWLHPAGLGGKDANDIVSIWRDACEEQHIILVGPKSESESGWLPSESESVQEAIREVLKDYTIDRRRIVAHGMGAGGQMAFYLGLNVRDWIRGVATTGAILAVAPKDNLPNQPLAFFVVAGAKDPLAKEIADIPARLGEKKLPIVFREVAEMGKEYLDRRTFEELLRWIDSLDRL